MPSICPGSENEETKPELPFSSGRPSIVWKSRLATRRLHSAPVQVSISVTHGTRTPRCNRGRTHRGSCHSSLTLPSKPCTSVPILDSHHTPEQHISELSIHLSSTEIKTELATHQAKRTQPSHHAIRFHSESISRFLSSNNTYPISFAFRLALTTSTSSAKLSLLALPSILEPFDCLTSWSFHIMRHSDVRQHHYTSSEPSLLPELLEAPLSHPFRIMLAFVASPASASTSFVSNVNASQHHRHQDNQPCIVLRETRLQDPPPYPRTPAS